MGGEVVNAWFDRTTHLPVFVAVRFEIPGHLTDGNAQPMWRIMSDFKFNGDVASDLFATEVPKGYQSFAIGGELPDQTPVTLHDVIEMLRLCVAANDAEFPLWLSINGDEGTPITIQHRFVANLEKQL